MYNKSNYLRLLDGRGWDEASHCDRHYPEQDVNAQQAAHDLASRGFTASEHARFDQQHGVAAAGPGQTRRGGAAVSGGARGAPRDAVYYSQSLLALLITYAFTVRILTQGSVVSEQIKVLHCDKNNYSLHSAYILNLGDFEGAEIWAYAASSLSSTTQLLT